MSRKDLSPAELEAYDRKKRAVDRMVREGKISRAQAKDRLVQSLADRAEIGRPAGRYGKTFTGKIRRASSKRKLPNMFLLTLLEPENYMTGVPDPFTLFPTTVERIKTQFVASPDASGDILIHGTGFKNAFVVGAGNVVYGGSNYNPGGTSTFSPYNWDSFNMQDGGSGVAVRLVATKWVVTYEGPLTDSAGRIAIAQFPSNGTSVSFPYSYDGVASYDYSYSGPVKDGATQIGVPVSMNSIAAFRDPDAVLSDAAYGPICVSCAGLTGGATPPAGENRINVCIYQVYEVLSWDPILTGRQEGTNRNSVAASHAASVVSGAHHAKLLNGHAGHSESAMDKIGKFWMDNTWGQRHWMWEATKKYGPKAAEWVMINALA
jgi:hypothetical protein